MVFTCICIQSLRTIPNIAYAWSEKILYFIPFINRGMQVTQDEAVTAG